MRRKTILCKRGTVLLIVVFLVAVLSVLLVGFLEMLTTDKQITQNQKDDIRALYLADAGVEYSLYELLNGQDGVLTRTEWPNTPDDNTYVTVAVTNTNGNITTIESTGEYATFSRAIEAKIMVNVGKATLLHWKEL